MRFKASRSSLPILGLLLTSPFAPLVACGGSNDIPPITSDGGSDASNEASTSHPDAADAADAADSGHVSVVDSSTSDAADAAAIPPENDGGGTDAIGDTPDAPNDANDASDASADADAVAPPSGTLLVAGDNLTLVDITSDGYAIYGIPTANSNVFSVYAVSLTPPSTGPAAPISLFTNQLGYVGVSGTYAFDFGTAASGSCAYDDSLTVWSATFNSPAGGAVPVSVTVADRGGSTPNSFSANANGFFAFPVWADTTCTTRQIATTQLGGINTLQYLPPSPGCGSSGVPGGFYPLYPTYASNGALTTFTECDPDGGGHSGLTTLYSPSGALVGAYGASLFGAYGAGVDGSFFDPTGAWLSVAPQSGEQSVIVRTSDGAVVAKLNTLGVTFDSIGRYAYAVVGGAVVQLDLAVDPPTSTTLLASGAGSIAAIDPNGHYLVVTARPDADAAVDTVGPTSLLPIAPAATPVPFLPAGTYATARFSVDGKYVLGSTSAGSAILATNGTVPTPLSPTIGALRPLEGSLFLANDVASGFATPKGLVLDASGTLPLSTFTPSYTSVRATSAGTQIAYTTTASPPGLYVVPTPAPTTADGG